MDKDQEEINKGDSEVENIIAKLIANAIAGGDEILKNEIDVIKEPKDGKFYIVLKSNDTFRVVVENAYE
jgi:hypothetical protein